MHTSPAVRFTLIGLISVLCLLSGPAAGAFEAGAAKVDITPPLGSPLNGYGDRMGRGAIKIHDPIWARCIYLNDGTTGVFWVVADLCIINPELRDRVLELAPREVPAENIILSATHTHSAQGGMVKGLLFRSVSGRFVPELLEQTAKGFAESMRLAYESRQPASIGFATGEQGVLSSNRRISGGPIDPQLGMLRVDNADGRPIAVLTNLAAHPTTIEGADMLTVSADYPGFYCVEMERLMGEGCIAVFANGTEGNQTCGNPEGKSDWGRTESMGRVLAERAKAVADSVKCADAKLHVGSATIQLPKSMAEFFLPSSVLLQTLEINDLFMAFFPGEACVEIGLALRQEALQRGYSGEFNVGLSNNFLAYFAPPEYYSQIFYESTMNFFGPTMMSRLVSEFTKLMTRSTPEADLPLPSAPETDELGGIKHVVLSGTPREVGYQRGLAFKDVITRCYQERIAAPVAAGKMLPQSGFWPEAAKYLNIQDYALLVFGIGTRPLLQGISNDLLFEIAGTAEAVDLPFDAVWLAQNAPLISAQASPDKFYRSAFCTMFATTGDRAGASDVLVGRNFDWVSGADGDLDSPLVLSEVHPQAGHAFLQIGFPWSAGTFTAMNDKGLVVCAERMMSLGDPPTEGAPIEFVLREIVQKAVKTAEAVQLLQAQKHLRGYHVLLASPSGPEAVVVELGSALASRKPVKGFLMGADPGGSATDPDAKVRYARVKELLEKEHIVGSAKMRSVLGDSAAGSAGMASILNEHTKCSVVFEPKSLTLNVAVPGQDGSLGEYAAVSLKGDAS